VREHPAFHRFRVLGAIVVAQARRPDLAHGAELRGLLEQIGMVGLHQEEDALAEVVDIHAAPDRVIDVGKRIRERERDFMHAVGAGFGIMPTANV